MKLVHEIDLVSYHLHNTKRLLIKNQLLVTTDVTVTSLFFSAVNNDMFVFFYITDVDYKINWIKEHFLDFSTRVACTVKVNIK